MTRSIHETRRSLRAANESDHARAEAHEEAVWFARNQLNRKRRIKRSVRGSRVSETAVRGLPDLPPQSAESVPITIHGFRAHYFHPLAPEDIRALIARLPVGALDGLQRIELRLGFDPVDDDLDYPEPDPLTGRPGIELVPGIWHQLVLGTYYAGGTIHINAFCADMDAVPFPAPELHLARLVVCNTVCHEIAHHVDAVSRVARGRWRMDDSRLNERFADAQAEEWMQTIGCDFVDERFPHGSGALTSWLRTRCCAPYSARRIAETFDVQLGGYFNALTQALADASKGKADIQVAIEYANELHYNEHYDEALAVLDSVLAQQPGNLDAIALQGEIAMHQKRYAEAETLAVRVLVRDASHRNALRVLRDVYRNRRDWPLLADVLGRDEPQLSALDRRQLARAYLELERWTDFEHQIAVLESSRYRSGRPFAEELRALRALRDGDAGQALRIVGPPRRGQRALCHLIRWEAAMRIGRPDDAGRLVKTTVDQLRVMESDWVARLEQEYGPIPTRRLSHREVRRNLESLRRL